MTGVVINAINNVAVDYNTFDWSKPIYKCDDSCSQTNQCNLIPPSDIQCNEVTNAGDPITTNCDIISATPRRYDGVGGTDPGYHYEDYCAHGTDCTACGVRIEQITYTVNGVQYTTGSDQWVAPGGSINNFDCCKDGGTLTGWPTCDGAYSPPPSPPRKPPPSPPPAYSHHPVVACAPHIFICYNNPNKGWDADNNVAKVGGCDITDSGDGGGVGHCNDPYQGGNQERPVNCERGYDCNACGIEYNNYGELESVPGTHCSDGSGDGCLSRLYTFDCCSSLCSYRPSEYPGTSGCTAPCSG